MTQPAISLAIRELEAEFGITLFTRFNNRLTLTEDGALFYKKADYILQYCKDMQFELNGSRIQQNPIHVGIPPVLSSFFFPGLIDAYRSKYPDALVSLEEYGSVRACDLVQEDKLDLALVIMELRMLPAFLLRGARHANCMTYFNLRTSVILPEAISDGGLAPTTDTSLFLTTYRGGSHLPSDIQY